MSKPLSFGCLLLSLCLALHAFGSTPLDYLKRRGCDTTYKSLAVQYLTHKAPHNPKSIEAFQQNAKLCYVTDLGPGSLDLKRHVLFCSKEGQQWAFYTRGHFYCTHERILSEAPLELDEIP